MLARKEFSDRFRSGWVVACIAVWLGAIGLTSFYGLVQVGRIGMQGYERTVISVLSLVQYLVPLLGLLIGHDLVVGEREEKTLALILASGVTRGRLLLGKFMGGCLTLGFPLVLGFAITGTAIGLTTGGNGIAGFLVLAVSGLALGIVFLGIGLAISSLCQTRLQALVIALLTWCAAVFVFDLLALGTVISMKAPAVSQEIEVACDPMHLNAAADLHSAYDSATADAHERVSKSNALSLSWILADPVDLFRVINLSSQTRVIIPRSVAAVIWGLWIGAALGLSLWKFRRVDL